MTSQERQEDISKDVKRVAYLRRHIAVTWTEQQDICGNWLRTYRDAQKHNQPILLIPAFC